MNGLWSITSESADQDRTESPATPVVKSKIAPGTSTFHFHDRRDHARLNEEGKKHLLVAFTPRSLLSPATVHSVAVLVVLKADARVARTGLLDLC